ncbi:hypothetical protein [Pseudomonas fontis]|uniref:Uncharacterized protein n=1 Tax=Pseudomonas fontis TaxID=2942633 RepID=A0ABT5NXS3_9PSED|nr:hypothetical protein [Pseudomonas fontis]MDD0973445.1 hypothetical protein [Pseudomonas fontis]MDD0992981.1 hypothetical protein [Pseudomonas fontis]
MNFFDCQVFDRTINGGLGRESRQGDVPVEADSLAQAEVQVRKEYPQWRSVGRFDVLCRVNDEE